MNLKNHIFITVFFLCIVISAQNTFISGKIFDKNDNSPLDENVDIFDLNKYSKIYINHLFNTNDMLGSMLLTLNNINFYLAVYQQYDHGLNHLHIIKHLPMEKS